MLSIIVTHMAYFLIAVLTPLAIVLARRIRWKIALPLLTTISVYFPFLLEVQISIARGMSLVLFWTGVQSLMILFYSYRNPQEMAELIWKAEEYTRGMFHWIASGELPEGSNRSLVLFHFKQGLVYAVLAIASANFLALMLGSALLNYMNYYVAQLALKSRRKSMAFLMGWNPWSVVRVLAFLYLGIILSAPALSFFVNMPFRFTWTALTPGLIGVILDVILKILLSQQWTRILRGILSTEVE